MNPLLLLFLLLAVSAFAAPRDIRRILAENDFVPGSKIDGAVIAYPEPSLTSWPVGAERIFITQFDPLPSVSTTLGAEQARLFAAILADRQTYNASLGGKACGGFHADVAIRVPGGTGSLYVILCFTCDQIQVLQHGIRLSVADTDRGRDRLLNFIRSIFPSNEYLKKLPAAEPTVAQRNWTQEVLEFAQSMIPDDPLLKRAHTLEPGEITPDDLEELDVRATAEFRKPDPKK